MWFNFVIYFTQLRRVVCVIVEMVAAEVCGLCCVRQEKRSIYKGTDPYMYMDHTDDNMCDKAKSEGRPTWNRYRPASEKDNGEKSIAWRYISDASCQTMVNCAGRSGLLGISVMRES